MLKIVVPMAGRGSRFANKGYTIPKPLITIHSQPMIRLVIENIRPRRPHQFIFLALDEHIAQFDLRTKLREWGGENSVVVPVAEVTQGAACTVLLAREFINSQDPIMIANSDQWVDLDLDAYLKSMDDRNLDGLIMTMKANDPKWSFVRINENLVTEVVEKVVVSDEATVGIYNFKSGTEFVSAADKMISENKRVNNEFYVAPVYNELISTGKRIGFFNIGSEGLGMYGLGIPEDLTKFVANDLSLKAVSKNLQ